MWGWAPAPDVDTPPSSQWSLSLSESLKVPCKPRTWTLTLASGERGTWRADAGWAPAEFHARFTDDGVLAVEFGLESSSGDEEEPRRRKTAPWGDGGDLVRGAVDPLGFDPVAVQAADSPFDF